MPALQNASEFIGNKYGNLLIISDLGRINGSRRVVAQCDCGNIKEISLDRLKSGNTKSCGCIVKGNPEIDLIGKKHNHFTIVSFLGYIKGRSHVLAKCDCGKEKSISLNELKTNNTKSCGCIKEVKNGLSHHSLHNIWVNMILRCTDSTQKAYKYYGGRGVKICKEWQDDFMVFYNWGIERWKPGLQLDKDLLSPHKPGLLYSPEFCCFLTSKQNCRNKSNNVIIEYNGESYCVTEWAEKLQIPYRRLKIRLERGWSIERAFNEPVKECNRR